VIKVYRVDHPSIMCYTGFGISISLTSRPRYTHRVTAVM